MPVVVAYKGIPNGIGSLIKLVESLHRNDVWKFSSNKYPVISYYKLEDVYNMDETRLYSRAHPNKTIAQGKVKGQKL